MTFERLANKKHKTKSERDGSTNRAGFRYILLHQLNALLQMYGLVSCSERSYVMSNNATGLSYHGIRLRQENLGNLRRFRYIASPADI